MRIGFWIVAIAAVSRLIADEVRFFPQAFDIPERGKVTAYVLLLQTNRFTFLPPPQWQVNFEPKERRSLLTSPDLTAAITIQVLSLEHPPKAPLEAEPLRAELMRRFPGAKILRESRCYLSAIQGLAFDLERAGDKGARVVTRQAFAPFSGGMLEFSLTAPQNKFESLRLAFSNVLTSFQIEAWAGSGK